MHSPDFAPFRVFAAPSAEDLRRSGGIWRIGLVSSGFLSILEQQLTIHGTSHIVVGCICGSICFSSSLIRPVRLNRMLAECRQSESGEGILVRSTAA